MNIQQIVEKLKQNQVVAYPTEAVFGLGCNPFSQSAVENLLVLKQRPIEKGLIIIAPDFSYFKPFVDDSTFTEIHWQRLNQYYDRPMTWVVPAKSTTPKFLTGQFSTIAIRLCDHPVVKKLCEETGFALTSTSANVTGHPPCKTAQQVLDQFGANFPVLDMDVGNAENPSEIRDLFTNKLFRQG